MAVASTKGLASLRRLQCVAQSNHFIPKRLKSTTRIPGPRCYPIIGSLPHMITNGGLDTKVIYLYFQRLFKIYGSVVKIQYPGNPPLVLIQDPEDVKILHHLTSKNPCRNDMFALKKAKYNNPYFENKGGIVVENGDEWWRVRSKVQAPVMKPKNIAAYIKDMDQVTKDFLKRVTENRDSTGMVTIDFLDELRKWSLESVCLVSLNQRIGCLSNGDDNETTKIIAKAAQDYMEAISICETGSKMWKFYKTKPFCAMEKNLDILKNLCDKVLLEAEANLDTRKTKLEDEDLNLIDHLLLKRDENFTRKDIVTFMLDIIPGGTSTTSDNLGVILYLLAKNPQAQRRLQEEIDSVFGDDTENITRRQLAMLSYTRAVIKEANRVMPAMFGPIRQLQMDVRLREYSFEKGWNVLFMNGLLGSEESVFNQADKFLPERWQRHRPLGDFHPFTIQPFSHGKRMCVGRRIAEQEMYIFIVRMFQRYNVEWKHADMVRDFNLFFSPTGPLKFTITER